MFIIDVSCYDYYKTLSRKELYEKFCAFWYVLNAEQLSAITLGSAVGPHPTVFRLALQSHYSWALHSVHSQHELGDHLGLRIKAWPAECKTDLKCCTVSQINGIKIFVFLQMNTIDYLAMIPQPEKKAKTCLFYSMGQLQILSSASSIALNKICVHFGVFLFCG